MATVYVGNHGNGCGGRLCGGSVAPWIIRRKRGGKQGKETLHSQVQRSSWLPAYLSTANSDPL